MTSKLGSKPRCPLWVTVPTLLWDKKTTSIRDADAESTRRRTGCVWSPGLGLGLSSEILGKNLHNRWEQASAVSGHQPRESALSTHNENNGAMMPLLKGGVELGVSERCHVLAAAPGP